MSSSPKHFAEVHDAELEEVNQRRINAGIGSPQAKPEEGVDTATAALRHRTGLALSGGGIRSASFNLGLLQALNQEHVLPQVDYLSTVSGGGYIGSHLSSLASIVPEETTTADGTYSTILDATGMLVTESPTSESKPSIDGERAKSMLAEGPTGQQPDSVRRLIQGGMYLNKPFSFFSRYALGLIAINLSLVSSMIFICCLAAFFFRCLDIPVVIDFLWACGFTGDVLRAFAPAIVCGTLWLISWILGYLFGFTTKARRIDPRLSTFFFGTTFIFTLLAIGALLGTGDISFEFLTSNFDVTPDTQQVNDVQHTIIVAAGIALVVTLLPYIRPNELIRSATNPRNAFESIAFKVASNGLLLGIPLLVFGLMASENVSHRNDMRPSYRFDDPNVDNSGLPGRFDVARTNIRPDEFWTKVTDEVIGLGAEYATPLNANAAGRNNSNGRANSAGQNNQSNASAGPASNQTKRHPSMRFWRELARIGPSAAKFHREIKQWDKETSLFNRLVSFYARWEARLRYDSLRDQLARRINISVLSDPQLYLDFANVIGDDENKQKKFDNAQKASKAFAAAQGKLLAENRQADPNGAGNASQTQERENEEIKKKIEKQLADQIELPHHIRNLRVANWELIEAHYGKKAIRSLDTIFAYNVTRFGKYGDQGWRLSVLWISGLVFLVAGCVVNLNITSIHGFYRDQLARMWLVPAKRGEEKVAVIPLRELRNSDIGLPYHLLNCTQNFIGTGPRRGSTSLFIMSKRYCGSHESDYKATDEYMGGHLDLANAMAISGAAVSPTVFNNWFLVAFLLVSNMRLGQWLHNPGKLPRKPRILDLPMKMPPAAIPIGIEYLICSPKVRQYCFITDGGHHENLGVEALLKRRCRVIICSDAGADPDTTFVDLTQLIRRMRIEEGIRFRGLNEEDDRVILDPLIARTGMAQRHFVVLKIHYPEAKPDNPDEVKTAHQIACGYLIYIKSSITGDEDIDLLRHKSANPNFPHDTTVDQFYDEQRFESYRQLGHHIGLDVCSAIFADAKQRRHEPWLAQWEPEGGSLCEDEAGDDPTP